MEHDGHGSQRGFNEEKLESATTDAIASKRTFLKLDASSSLVRGWYPIRRCAASRRETDGIVAMITPVH